MQSEGTIFNAGTACFKLHNKRLPLFTSLQHPSTMLLPVHYFHKKIYVFRNLPNGKVEILNLFRRKD